MTYNERLYPHWRISIYGNGIAVAIDSRNTLAMNFLQGDDAVTFIAELSENENPDNYISNFMMEGQSK